MATVINNPSTTDTEGNGVGIIIGIILAILFAIVLVVYGIPALRGTSAPAATDSGNTKTLDVNLNTNGTPSGSTNTGGSTGGSTR